MRELLLILQCIDSGLGQDSKSLKLNPLERERWKESRWGFKIQYLRVECLFVMVELGLGFGFSISFEKTRGMMKKKEKER